MVLEVGFVVSEGSLGVRRGLPRGLGDGVMEILGGSDFECLGLAGLETSFRGMGFLA